jgi:transketolase
MIAQTEWHDSMIITNGARRLMHKWTANKIVLDYTLSPDWDDRWRTGGSLDEIIKEAHLDSESVLKGIQIFAKDRTKRLSQLKSELPES